MEFSVTEWLEGLERPALETLLRRRPEARSLFGAKRCDLRALAEAISRPEAVLAAAEQCPMGAIRVSSAKRGAQAA